MYNMVKTMLGLPGWKSKTMTLPNVPMEPQMLYYQDIVKCTHYLFERPDLEANMDYVPMEVKNKFDDDHIYLEVCTGHKWSKQQVRISIHLHLNIWDLD